MRGQRAVGVITVDDQAAFRDVAREVIEATVGFEPLGEAACGEEALVLAGDVEPDLVLLDVRMPGIDGLETARRLSAAHPAVDDRAGLDGGPRWAVCGRRVLRCRGADPQGRFRALHAATVMVRARPGAFLNGASGMSAAISAVCAPRRTSGP